MVQRMVERNPAMKPTLDNASPMKRMGEPEEIARCVAFLVSDDAAFINGSVPVRTGMTTIGIPG